MSSDFQVKKTFCRQKNHFELLDKLVIQILSYGQTEILHLYTQEDTTHVRGKLADRLNV